jgi:hypothetical protein
VLILYVLIPVIPAKFCICRYYKVPNTGKPVSVLPVLGTLDCSVCTFSTLLYTAILTATLSGYFLLGNRKYPDNVFYCRDISCWPKLCRDISCCPTGNIPTAFFCVGIFPVGQFCRDISFWHNVGIFPIGCVGTSTFPHKVRIVWAKK